MAKRTNDFQQLVALIYSQIKPTGATVAESMLLKERGSATEREVDVLLECSIAETQIRIAIECRRKGRKNDIKWIDELIGKYRDLDVAKVIAVSNQPFSEAAVQKAKANRIDTLTLREALDTDWTTTLIRLGMARTTRHDVPKRLRVITKPPPEYPPTATDTITDADGTHLGSLDEIAGSFFERNKDKLSQQIRAQFFQLFRTVAGLHTHSIRSDLTWRPPRPLVLKQTDDKVRLIDQIILTVESTVMVEPVDVSQFALGDIRVSQATMSLDENDEPLTITAVQNSDQPGEIRVAVRSSGIRDNASNKKGTVRKASRPGRKPRTKR